MPKWALVLFLTTFIWAESTINLSDFQELNYVSVKGDPLKIPNTTKRLVISFDQEGNGLLSAFLKTKQNSFLADRETVYIGDIGQMPLIVTNIFAKPIMQGYNFTVFLHEDDGLKKLVPHRQNRVTVVVFNENGKYEELFFTNIAQQAFGLID